MKKKLLFFGWFLVLFGGLAHANANKPPNKPTPEEIAASTTPIASPFYRFLADDFGIDLRELVKFERKGFSRTEIVTLVLLSESDVKKLKEIGNRGIKDLVPLETLVKEAGLDYNSMIKVAHQIKADIESRPEKDLPPPVFEKPKDPKEKK